MNSHNILVFAAGVLAVVLLAGAIVGVTSIRTTRNQVKIGSQDLGPEQLHFAAAILTGLGLLFSLAMAMNIWGGERGEKVFDACKTAIPPIATLVLGYYFGKERHAPETGKPAGEGTASERAK